MYAYDLPTDLIAASPAEPRDSARLLVFEAASGKIEFDVFSNLAAHLPQPALMVLNETKVVPARLTLRKQSGGKVEALFLVNEWNGSGPIQIMADRRIDVGGKLHADALGRRFEFNVVAQTEHIFSLELLFESGDLIKLLEDSGTTPVPKYIKGIDLPEDRLRSRYQTIFASNPASVAAPTASLHFTEHVFESMKRAGIQTAKLTLNVGLGTFAPVSEMNHREGKLHSESFEIPGQSAAAIRAAKQSGTPIVAVGTTTVRALESAGSDLEDGKAAVSGKTEIFIRPPFRFKVVDSLITNFHLPESSLMMLVEAFLQYKKSPLSLTDIYREAIKNRFRFYSFGDSMLIK